MKKNYLSLALLVSLMLSLVACEKDETNSSVKDLGNYTDVSERTIPDAYEGVIRVKFKSEVGDKLSENSSSALTKSGNSELDFYLNSIGAKSIKRVYEDERFEERMRNAGLHLWYDVEFDDNQPTTKVAVDLKDFDWIDVAEPVFIPIVPQSKIVPADEVIGTKALTGNKFNDPQLKYQWHYNNDATIDNNIYGLFTQGADINLEAAWRIETGKPNVVVAIVDGGIDVSHEDLKANLWVNPDATSPYKNGYNFVRGNGYITADEHGTHVAGTVAAVNNNGKGVCGIAGGDGTANSGVRLMSCQIFEGTNGKADGSKAIIWAANNGAVICQNSWGYPYGSAWYLPQYLQDAIDYFIDYAGCDKNKKQLPNSPMKGGVVIFAAGNDKNIDFEAIPASYNRVIAVASMGPNFKAAYYTTVGSWVDITAPGGLLYSNYKYGGVLSTIPGGYGYQQGTSMACPHVSGIAALVVSRFGGQGFTNDKLKEILLGATKDTPNINTQNPNFYNKLGRGYIDAAKALGAKVEVNPNPDEGNNPGETNPDNYVAPTVIKNFANLNLKIGESSAIINLDEYFRSFDGSALTFNARTSNSYIVSGTIGSKRMQLKGVSAGTATITVTAQDSKGGVITQYFTVTVTATASETPNPQDPQNPVVTPGAIANVSLAYPYLNLSIANDISYCYIKISDSYGYTKYVKNYFSGDSKNISISLSKFTAGKYTLLLRSSGKTQTVTITLN